MDLAPREALMIEEESSPLSLLKLPMKRQVVGQLHQMVHMHGDIALLENETNQTATVTPTSGHALKNTLAEDPSNYLTTTTMGNLETQLGGT